MAPIVQNSERNEINRSAVNQPLNNTIINFGFLQNIDLHFTFNIYIGSSFFETFRFYFNLSKIIWAMIYLLLFIFYCYLISGDIMIKNIYQCLCLCLWFLGAIYFLFLFLLSVF